MDKQTFYAELSERLKQLEVGRDYIERHIKQFDAYFAGKTDDEIVAEIAKLGDLDRVASRIKRMTDKMISNEAKAMAESQETVASENQTELPQDDVTNASHPNCDENVEDKPSDTNASDDDVITFKNKEPKKRARIKDEAINLKGDMGEALSIPESHGTRRGSGLVAENTDEEIVPVSLDEQTIQKNRQKFWLIFAATLPITVAVLMATALAFAFTFFLIAVMIIIAVAALVAITAVGTLVSVLGMIFGVAQMLSSLPVGLYECGIAIMAGSVALFSGILVYNFAVRLMPFAAKWLLALGRYVIRKYKELFVYLKKECIGL